MPRKSKKTARDSSPKKRGHKLTKDPCRFISPDALMRPAPCIREAPFCSSGCASYRSIRGYRPGDFFTRGISLGGDARIGGVACASASTYAAEGFSTWRPMSCANVPKITACSRFWSSGERTKQDRASSSSSSEEEREPVQQKCPDPPKCVCTTQVETKKFTNDAFTMTERRARDQGTAMDPNTSDKIVDATIVMRDVATDIEEDFDVTFRKTLSSIRDVEETPSGTIVKQSLSFKLSRPDLT